MSSPALSAGMVTSFGHPTRAGPASIRCVVGGYYDLGTGQYFSAGETSMTG